MKNLFPVMYERPETHTLVSGITYWGFAFLALPFLLALLMQGSFQNTAVLSGMEIFYHAVNFAVAAFIFREYLKESFLDFRVDFKKILSAAGIVLLLVVILTFTIGYASAILNSPFLGFIAASMLPLAENDLFALSFDIVYLSPLWGTLCMVLFVPITVSCLLYSTAFAPACCNRPGLAYLAAIVTLAIPRCCNALSLWDFQTELVLFLSQLPIHLLACWTYQKTDNVWAPILTLSSANLFSCLLIILSL